MIESCELVVQNVVTARTEKGTQIEANHFQHRYVLLTFAMMKSSERLVLSTFVSNPPLYSFFVDVVNENTFCKIPPSINKPKTTLFDVSVC